ncbi:hypothetical protein CO172_01070 [Candidatus Uhrbacteria bacterium CG_4_9_14_3_um_filter_36_7]|uniref:Glycosyltransferase RgtA/B/C/D-like domain-containing protein n=1 Tax=Candidatus Uhrbacteria bacterium CG_4_9_14_3_um_filter_36_7 TaxID=1975033 RepID=A0A2M7XIG1_9BACT|nr:MAG: hypothetical protein CO172_01070 [Candidatus Uhrbacteria bacterium CG_4_9_14_3_um_filter_36_7]
MLASILTSLKFNTLSALFLGLFLLNLWVFHSPIAGLGLFIFFILLYGIRLGQICFKQINSLLQATIGIWILLSMIIIIGSIAYYIFALPSILMIMLVLFASVLMIWINHSYGSKINFPTNHEETQLNRISSYKLNRVLFWFFSSIFLLLFIFSLFLLHSGATFNAIRSPWETVPSSLFVLFVIITFSFLYISFYHQKKQSVLFFAILIIFLFLSVAIFVYPLGYGFDTFIHKATENYIAAHGSITPKPFYYIGQYVFVLFAHHAFFLPITLFDTLLVPLLAACFLPLAWFSASNALLGKISSGISSLWILFLLPLGSFIVTTPQGLANIWMILLMLFAIPKYMHLSMPLWPFLIGGVATIIIHPFSGLPILFFLLLLFFLQYIKNISLQKIGLFFTILLGSMILPISFFLNQFSSKQPLTIHFNLSSLNISWEKIILLFSPPNHFHPLFDFIYLFEHNRWFILLLASFLTIFWYKKTHWQKLKPFFFFFLMLIGNYLILKIAVDFTFLIDYERSNYTDRLIPLAFFSLSPFLILFSETFHRRLIAVPKSIKFFSLFLLTALITSAFYLTYPRMDIYEKSHGYNVSQSDKEVVLSIENDAAYFNKDYIVLANQNVSASAISELGFKKYYEDVFFYPIPTGGKLYSYFLAMNENPSQKIAKEALALVNAKRVYFVVNDYWWDSTRIKEQAKTTASSWWQMDEVSIFVYE